jgi:cold shock CspA family protein
MSVLVVAQRRPGLQVEVFVHISTVEKAGLVGLKEGQAIEYEEVSN